MKIGNVELKNNLILAPMAGVTDLPFRLICEEFGPGLVYTEMVSSKGLYYNDHKTQRILDTTEEKHPIAFQIFGSDPETMAFATKLLNDNYPLDILDINMGCPVPKVVKNGDGSALLLDLKKAEEIIKAVVENSRVPVTVKMRTGWDKNDFVADKLAKIARSEFYSGTSDLDKIKKVKEVVNIPVIGNGDIVDELSAKHMLEYTGVDAIMIGRGALGNPWIFDRINYFFETGKIKPATSNEEKLKIIKKHIEFLTKFKGELVGVKEFRKHIAWYTKGLKNSSEFRNKALQIEEKAELIDLINEYFSTL